MKARSPNIDLHSLRSHSLPLLHFLMPRLSSSIILVREYSVDRLWVLLTNVAHILQWAYYSAE